MQHANKEPIFRLINRSWLGTSWLRCFLKGTIKLFSDFSYFCKKDNTHYDQILMNNKIIPIALICLSLCSCDSDLFDTTPLSVSPTSLTLYVGDTYQLTVNKTKNITYTPLDPWYASVGNSGLVTAKKLGKTKIIVSDDYNTEYVSVEVKSTYQLYPDMDYYIGKKFDAFDGAFGNFDDTSSTDDYITFWYDHRTKYDISFGFIFKKGDEFGTIQAVTIYIPVTYENQMETYLWDRYICPETLNDVYYFYNHDKDVGIKLEYKSSQRAYNILYYPID